MSWLLVYRFSKNSISNLNRFVSKQNPIVGINYRTLLSPSYSCEELWLQQRVNCESLKHITPERYFFELNQRYQQKRPVSAVDVDIYVNSVYKSENQDELEHIVKRFRQSRLTTKTLESTHYAFCRFYLQHDLRQQLLKVLNERVTFGIFPDTYIYNLLMDRSIQDGNLDDAFEIVKLMMLQEDSGNEISKTLALYTLTRLLTEGKFGQKMEKEELKEETVDGDDDDEIEYIRVPYLTNPYFDDHFDLTDRNQIFGKSLYFFGHELSKSNVESDRMVSATAQIIGLVFYQKFDKLKNCLKKMETIEITSEPLEIVSKQIEQCEDDSVKAELTDIRSLLQKMTSTSSKLMTDLIDVRILELPKLETSDIENQKQLFECFENLRVGEIKSQLETLLHAEKLREYEQKKQELDDKKRLYYFFENFPKHEIDFVEAEKRIKEIQQNTTIDEDYIPPEI